MSESATAAVDPYAEIGGDAGVRELVDHFYDAMERLPEADAVRGLHAADLSEMRDKLYEFLSGWLGGPPLFFDRHGPSCIRSAHAPFAIDWRARDQWLLCMSHAMDEMEVAPPLRKLLDTGFARMAEAFRNVPD